MGILIANIDDLPMVLTFVINTVIMHAVVVCVKPPAKVLQSFVLY